MRPPNFWYDTAMQIDNEPPQALESIGRRIAQLRQELGWTQQALAARISISRVAVSHIEMDLSIPSERTITLLAGLFKRSPVDLVSGTTYPVAKAERLPEITPWYTRLELELALLEKDLEWLQFIDDGERQADVRQRCLAEWRSRLSAWSEETIDDQERKLISAAQKRLEGV